jgi:hypothetical protein
MKPTTEDLPFKGFSSMHFFLRAQHYRLAASATEDQNDMQVFIELAMMFDEIGFAFRRIETKRRHSADVR